MESFLKHCPTSPNAFFGGGPSDIFVTELTDQVYLHWESCGYHKKYTCDSYAKLLHMFMLVASEVEGGTSAAALSFTSQNTSGYYIGHSDAFNWLFFQLYIASLISISVITQAWNWEWLRIWDWKVVCIVSHVMGVPCIPQELFAMQLGRL